MRVLVINDGDVTFSKEDDDILRVEVMGRDDDGKFVSVEERFIGPGEFAEFHVTKQQTIQVYEDAGDED